MSRAGKTIIHVGRDGTTSYTSGSEEFNPYRFRDGRDRLDAKYHTHPTNLTDIPISEEERMDIICYDQFGVPAKDLTYEQRQIMLKASLASVANPHVTTVLPGQEGVGNALGLLLWVLIIGGLVAGVPALCRWIEPMMAAIAASGGG